MARQIVVSIIGDAKQFDKTLDATGAKAETFGSKFTGTAKAVLGYGTAIGGSMAVASGVLFDHSKDLDAMNRKAEVVFGDSIGDIDKWASANAHAFGLTTTQLKYNAAAMQDLLVPMGFTRDRATEITKKMAGLSGALSEWSGGNVSATEANEALSKAMLGQYDALIPLGIKLDSAAVAAQVAADGNDKLTGSALQQAQATAVMELALAKSTDAQKAFADGANEPQRKAAEMGASIREAFDNISQAAAPVTQILGPMAVGFGQLATGLGPLKGAALAASGALGGTQVATLAVSGAQKVAAVTSYALGGAIRFMTGPLGLIVTAIGVLAGAWATNFGGIREKTAAVVNFITGAIGGFINFFTSLPGRIASIAGHLWDSIPKAFRAAINFLIGIWNRLGFTVPSVDLPIIGKIGGFRVGVPQIPYLHTGGYVPGTPGSDVPAILQAGEYVVPRGQAGRSIVINIGSFMGDVDELAETIAYRLRVAGA